MNGKNREGASRKRIYRTIKVAPTARAIRSALALSAALLALSGSGAALAGTCAVTSLNEVTCNGVFTDDVTNTVPVINLVEDLTLIVGTDGTTTVDPAAGSNGITSTWNGDAVVVNYAEINVQDAYGIYMYSIDGTASVTNDGSIYAYSAAADATGIYAGAYYDVSVVNGGDILAGAATLSATNVTGVSTYSYDGVSNVTNEATGTITAASYGGTATGISGYGYYGSTVTNDGDLNASSINGFAVGGWSVASDGDAVFNNNGTIESYSLTGDTVGAGAISFYGNAAVYNDGSIDAGGGGYATGVEVLSAGADAIVDNGGTITVTSYNADATGVAAYGKYSDVSNSGSISASGYTGAVGIASLGTYGANVTNDGSIDVAAYGATGQAAGISAYGNGYLNVTNNGDINVTSTGDGSGPVATLLPYVYGANATGISAVSVYDAGVPTLLSGPSDVNVVNTGNIYVNAAGDGTGIYAATFGAGSVYVDNQGDINANAGGYAYGVSVYSDYGTVEVQNSGSIEAYAYTGYGRGIYASTSGVDGAITVYSSGSIYAYSHDDYAIGIDAYSSGDGGSIDISTSATSSIDTYSYGWDAQGIRATTTGAGSDLTIDNAGSINAYTADFHAYGINALVTGADSALTIYNSGAITATTLNGDTYGIAGEVAAGSGDLGIYNSGSISLYSSEDAEGIRAFAVDSTITVGNSGSIYATSGGYTYGIYAASTGSGYIYIDNSGSIDVYAVAPAVGIEANGWDTGDVNVSNSGSIYAYSSGDEATGIYAYAAYGNIYVDNSGSIETYSYDEGYGIDTYAYGDGNITITSSGSILVTSTDAQAEGINAVGNGAGYVYVDNSGAVDVYAFGVSTGIYATSVAGDIGIVNSGDVYAYSSGSPAYGIDAVGNYSVYVNNSGSSSAYSYLFAEGISASSTGGDVFVYNSGSAYAGSTYLAVGIAASAPYDTYVLNTGYVTAYATNGVGDASAIGIAANSPGGAGAGNTYTSVANYGDVLANANAYGLADAIGIKVAAGGTGTSYADVANFGSVEAYAYGDMAFATGISVDPAYGSVEQYGDVYAFAQGYTLAQAEGVYVQGDIGASFYSAGGSSTRAYATSYQGAIAAGVVVSGGAYAAVTNYGDVGAYAVTYGATYGALAIGIAAGADSVYFYNGGNVYAYAYGYGGLAEGVVLDSVNSMTAYNGGYIGAVGAGAYTAAIGLDATSDGDVSVINYGGIYATSDYVAIGVELNTDTYGYVYNSGTIQADGAGTNVAIYSTGLSADYIYNQGTITGAIWTGANDDYLFNGGDGVWNATGVSDFGDGDDVIFNGGFINMQDAVIDLGGYAVNGNGFYNYGNVTVSGYNDIYMGTGNPNAFYNYGQIDFQDGAADDLLVIHGDFAGYGNINVDSRGFDQTSDILYIVGNVAYYSQNTVNVELLDLPQDLSTEIPIVYVSGDSVDANFDLGVVNWDFADSFVTLDFDLISHIDATNATPDVFALGIEVTGLSDPGTIAAAVPAVVQGLMNTQVGTWRQRMGVIDNFNKGAISLWARVFYDRGDYSPEFENTNFGQGGNFDYEQMNSGAEAGVDFAVTDEFSLGLLLAKSRAKAKLGDPGIASAKVEGDTWGVYGTWISPNGFYLDASYRWMSFDVTTESSAGVLTGDGDAEAFNIEVGYAWTMSSGLKIEPQFQYTKTNVDNLSVLQTSTGMTFANEGGDSSRGRLGVSLRKAFGDADSGWLWTPYVTLSAVREFDGENHYAINDVFFGSTTVEGTSFLLELGATARHGNWAIYGGLNWQDGGAVDSLFGGQLGVRYTFGGAAPVAPPPPPPPAKTCADLDDDGDGVNNCDDKCLGTAAGTAVGPDGCPLPAPEPAPEPKPFRG